MRRYLRLYRVFWENCFAREAEFRANFWANVLANAGWLVFFVAFIKVVYRSTSAIAGWSEGEALALTGTFGVVQGIFQIFAYQNLSRLPELVRLGTLDFILIKPVDSQFFVSSRYVKLDSIGNLFGACFVVLYGVSAARTPVTPGAVAAYGAMVLCALAIFYGIYMLLMTLSIWFIRLDNLAVLADMIFHVARYPSDIFAGWPKLLFTYVVPIAFLATLPARALFGRLPPVEIIAAALLGAALLAFSALFWRFALRFYSSASS
jgi:ABC-2 type transport system permease protein